MSDTKAPDDVKCPICGYGREGRYPQLIEFILWRMRDRMRELFLGETIES